MAGDFIIIQFISNYATIAAPLFILKRKKNEVSLGTRRRGSILEDKGEHLKPDDHGIL